VATEALTLNELRAILADNIRRTQAAEISPAVANATTNAVGTILRTVKLEMDYFKMTGKTPSIPLLDPPALKD
jgi:hypothetical protein